MKKIFSLYFIAIFLAVAGAVALSSVNIVSAIAIPGVGDECSVATNGCDFGLTCDTAVTPSICRVSPGDPCATSAECLTGFICGAGNKCVQSPGATAGEDCLDNSSPPKSIANCGTGTVCDRSTKKCALSVTEPCVNTSQCYTGLNCAVVPNVTTSSRCTLPESKAFCPSLSNSLIGFDKSKGTIVWPSGSDPRKISGGLVPCGRTCDDPTTPTINESATCTLCSGFVLFNNIINAVLFVWMPLIIVILVTWGGVLIMVSGQAPQQRLRGRQIIQWALMGYALMLCSWIIVNTFLSIIGVADWSGVGNWWNPTCGS